MVAHRTRIISHPFHGNPARLECLNKVGRTYCMNERWNVELHSHTLWSKDCVVPFERIIELCHQRGVDRIAITDHNTAEGALAMQKLAPDLVIVGEEIMTPQGEILAYFMTESI